MPQLLIGSVVHYHLVRNEDIRDRYRSIEPIVEKFRERCFQHIIHTACRWQLTKGLIQRETAMS